MKSFAALWLTGLASTVGLSFVRPPVPNPPSVSTTFFCRYTGGPTPGGPITCTTLNSRANGHAERVVDRILKPIGLARNFKILECPNTQNCFATVMGGQRFVIYDGAFMQRIEDQTQTDWSAISIMAHEIGHHLQGHTIDGRGGQPQKELEADRFSGFVLHQLGAPLDASLIAARTLGNEYATPTHPARPARVEAIRKGWLEAEAMYPHARRPVAAAPAPRPANVVKPNATTLVAATSVAATNVVGCVSGNCQDGRGVLVYPTRERYVGAFDAGTRHGEGTEYYADGRVKYKGGFRDNQRSDYGVYMYRNGDRYAGGFQRGLPQGKGKYYFADGDRFVGLFRQGQRHGYGVLYNQNGTVAEAGHYVADELTE